MNLKKTLGILGKRLASAGAAVSIGISATAGSPLPDREGHEIRQVKKEQAPRRSVEDLENAVRDRVWINGKPQSERIHEIRKIRETEGAKAAFDYLEQSKYEKVEIREKRSDGSYAFWIPISPDETKMEIWHPNGVLAVRTFEKTGESIGFYPDGSKSFEQKSFNDLRYEYYPNGQLKMSPHKTNRDAYDIFDEYGRKVLHRHAIDSDNILRADLFDEKGENCVASYVLSDYASSVQNGILSETGKMIKVSILNDNSKMKSYQFKKPPILVDDDRGHFEFSLDNLKELIHDDRQVQQINNLRLSRKLKDR